MDSSMEEMPKKVLQSDRCLICSTAVQKKEKIYIFGKNSFDFPAIISSCLDVNVSCYSATSELSVCKVCYRRLIKFKKASDHLEEFKYELKGFYKDHELPRTKPLLSTEPEDNGQTPVTCRGKASKSLQFPIHTTCAASALHPILLQFMAIRNIITLGQDCLLVYLLFKVSPTDLCFELFLVSWM